MKPAILVALAALAGCAEADPYQRTGMWQPTGANSLNLAAMVSNPNDLLRGHGQRGAAAVDSGGAVTRLWSGRAAALPNAQTQGAAPSPSAAPPPNAP